VKEATPSPVLTEKRYSVRDAALLLGWSYATVWRAARSGDLPATRRGEHGRYLIKETDLIAWAFPER